MSATTTDALTAAQVAAAIRGFRFRYHDEDRLQQGIAKALALGYLVEREVRLTPHSRIDLLVDGRIGVEVKVAGSREPVERQIRRYLETDLLDGLVLVTTRVRHLGIARAWNGKPIEIVSLVEAAL